MQTYKYTNTQIRAHAHAQALFDMFALMEDQTIEERLTELVDTILEEKDIHPGGGGGGEGEGGASGGDDEGVKKLPSKQKHKVMHDSCDNTTASTTP